MAYKFNIFTGTLDIVGNSGSGSGVQGPPISTNGAITSWNGTTGNVLQDNPNTNVQPSGAIEAQAFITKQQVTGTVIVNQDECWIAPSLNITPSGSIDLTRGGSLKIV
jgi:hypothetical protein